MRRILPRRDSEAESLVITHRSLPDGTTFELGVGEAIAWYDYDYEAQMWHLGILSAGADKK